MDDTSLDESYDQTNFGQWTYLMEQTCPLYDDPQRLHLFSLQQTGRSD